LSLGVPKNLTSVGRRKPGNPEQPNWPAWTDQFLDGLFALAATHKATLAGGDLAESPIALADIVLVGAVPRGGALLRSTARSGDLLYVTGSLGGSAAALAQLAQLAESSGQSKSRPPRIPKKHAAGLAPHLYPQPRIAQGLRLQRRGLASAAIDLSDGLSTDLNHLCEESRVAAEVDCAALPIHPSATVIQALNGGEDYELLFTSPAATPIPRQIADVPVTRIGRIVPARANRPTVTLLTPTGPQALHAQGWKHFS
jgi:thiamine-monophosphate kinase